jgi:NADH:ubiquinone oxidoreductase subunit F (NADH-binding)
MTATTHTDTLLDGGDCPIPWRGGPGRLVAELEAAGLTGRGGAGFPAWRKAATALRGRSPVVVANGAEGEPLSRKDTTLLEANPHVVLDGLQLTAEAVGASRAFLYVPRGSAGIAALAERHGRDRVPVTVVHAPDRFVSGEESAVIAAIEGRDALPRFRTEPAPVSGVDGRPTVVHNVETLAHVAMIARHGPAWFRRTGTPDEPGTFLATVSGYVAVPGVYEVPVGIPVDELLAMAGGLAGTRAVLVGGYHGVWAPVDAVPMSRAGLAPYGGSPGAGIVHALPANRCPLRFAAEVTRYLAEQSAGKCGPCLNGLPAIAATMTALSVGRAEARRLEWLTGLVTGRGACHHPDGTVRFVRSTLTTFAADVTAHQHGHCTVGELS